MSLKNLNPSYRHNFSQTTMTMLEKLRDIIGKDIQEFDLTEIIGDNTREVDFGEDDFQKGEKEKVKSVVLPSVNVDELEKWATKDIIVLASYDDVNETIKVLAVCDKKYLPIMRV